MVYLPTHAERQEIFGIHTADCVSASPISSTSTASPSSPRGYTGADIKEVVQLGLKLAFHAGAELSNDHLIAAIPENPAAVEDRPRIGHRSHQVARTVTPSRLATVTPTSQPLNPGEPATQAACDRLIPSYCEKLGPLVNLVRQAVRNCCISQPGARLHSSSHALDA